MKRKETKAEHEDRRWKDQETREMLGINSLKEIDTLPEPLFYKEWAETPWQK